MPRQAQSLEGLDLPESLDPDLDKGPQIRAILELIAVKLGPGQTMPSERSLAEQFGVARMTVRNQVLSLASDGVLTVHPSKGTFVADSLLIRQSLGTSFSTVDGGRTNEVGSMVLEKEVRPAGQRLARVFGLDVDSPVLRLVRLRSMRGLPVGIERSSLPLDRFPGLHLHDLGDRSLYAHIESEYGVRRRRIESTARSVLPDAGEAAQLGCTVQDPCLAVTSLVVDVDGAAIESGRSTYRGDRYELSTAWELHSGPA